MDPDMRLKKVSLEAGIQVEFELSQSVNFLLSAY